MGNKPKTWERFNIEYPNTPAGKKQWLRQFGANAYYAGKHWAKRAKDAEYWHNMVRACMERQGVRREPFQRPVEIRFLFNDRLDCSNHSIMVKMIEDALKGRVIVDDSRKWVKQHTIGFHDGDCIEVEIKEI